jgi:hypothetical protein
MARSQLLADFWHPTGYTLRGSNCQRGGSTTPTSAGAPRGVPAMQVHSLECNTVGGYHVDSMEYKLSDGGSGERR